MMYACQLNHLSIADRLIEAGADLELPLTVSYVNEHGYIVASYLLTMSVFSTLHSVANCQLVSFLRLQKTLLHVFISIYVVLLVKLILIFISLCTLPGWLDPTNGSQPEWPS